MRSARCAPPSTEPLLERLMIACQQPFERENLERAAADLAPGDWTDHLHDATARLGLRARWLTAEPGEIADLARADLPVVTAARDSLGQIEWWVLDGRAPGRVRATRVDDPLGPSWRTIAQLTELLGPDRRPWALIEPLLPASPMAARAGEPTPSPLRRLLGLLRIERDDLAVVGVYAVGIGLLSLTTPLVMQVLINWLAFGQQRIALYRRCARYCHWS